MWKLALLLSSLPAWCGIDAKIVGNWTAVDPATGNRVRLKIESDGRCSVDAAVGKCQSMLRLLVVQVGNRPATTYTYQWKNSKLTIAGGGLAQPMVFEPAVAEPVNVAPSSPPPGAPPTPLPEKAIPGADAGRYSHPYWGLSFVVPPAWKANERDGILLLGSDSEAGLIIIRFASSTNRQMLLAEYAQGFTDSGVTLRPAAPAADFQAGNNRAIAGELTGAGQNGQRLRARVIALPSPFGDAAVVMGLTTEEKYPQLKARTEDAAATIAFTQPKLPPVNQMIAGNYYYIYVSKSGGTYSREDKLMLCANGMFSRGGEMYGNFNTGSAASQSANSGTWRADGNGQTGSITLMYRNGKSETMRYQKSGQDIVLNGKKYGANGNGACGSR